MAKRWTKRWLQDQEIPRLERVLKAADLASVGELKALAERYRGGAFADYCEWCRKLSTFARRQEWKARATGDNQAADVWELAQAALEDRAEVVDLASVKRKVSVRPASWARIMQVEDCDWWLLRLSAARLALRNKADDGEKIENLDDLMGQIRREIASVRSILYAQITAPTPAPVDESVDWANRITPIEEGRLLQAWHDVNTDILRRLRAPKSKKDGSSLPPSWSMLFQSVAWRNNEYPKHIIQNWSLVAICAENMIEAMKEVDREKRSPKVH